MWPLQLLPCHGSYCKANVCMCHDLAQGCADSQVIVNRAPNILGNEATCSLVYFVGPNPPTQKISENVTAGMEQYRQTDSQTEEQSEYFAGNKESQSIWC